jgi:hypothetical protein
VRQFITSSDLAAPLVHQPALQELQERGAAVRDRAGVQVEVVSLVVPNN